MAFATIYFLGPLYLQLDLKVKRPAMNCGDRHLARDNDLIYGGTLVRQARILKSWGYNVEVIGFVGNDMVGEKIIETVSQDGLGKNFQRIPNFRTPINVNLSNGRSSSEIFTYIKNIDLWVARIKNIKNNGIFVCDPSLPAYILEDLASRSKKNTVVTRMPLNRCSKILKSKGRFIFIFSEYDTYELSLSHGRYFIDPQGIFRTVRDLWDRDVIICGEREMLAQNSDAQVVGVNLCGIRKSDVLADDYFCSGVIAGYASKKDKLTAASWGLATTLLSFKSQPIDKMSVIKKAMEFEWKNYYSALESDSELEELIDASREAERGNVGWLSSEISFSK